MEESKEQFAEGYRVQENRNLQDEGTAEPSLSRARRRMSFMAGAEFTWSKDIIDHDMLEQMVETRSWKVSRGLAQDKQCRVCHERDETVEHIVAGCKVLANSEYLTRHNRALMIMAVNWAKEYELIGNDVIWYKERWERGAVLENE